MLLFCGYDDDDIFKLLSLLVVGSWEFSLFRAWERRVSPPLCTWTGILFAKKPMSGGGMKGEEGGKKGKKERGFMMRGSPLFHRL